ncbi:hypothetical protein A3740_11690 [Oleiphilus sp. HI0068]|nr:hypothetical protein A3740_11690 [Oleiphilus sp. HI0068]KZY85777.1 hypothetical protein A3741_14950 [Oleiphilus sp. HI0069]
MDQQRKIINEEDELGFIDVVREVWRKRWIVAVVTGVMAILSTLYGVSISKEYTSRAILAPSDSSGSSSVSRIAGEFGGLASLAGVRLPNSGGGKAAIALEILQTWGFIERFIAEHELQVALMAAIGWDKKKNSLIIDDSIYDVSRNHWRLGEDGNEVIPSSWQLYNQFLNRLEVSEDKKTGFVSIAIEYYSPYIAKQWVDNLVVSLNSYMQQVEKHQAEKSISYLQQQIEKTEISEMRSIFFQLIEEQTKTLMLTSVSDEYVFRTISSAKVAEQKSKPRVPLIIAVFTMLGFIGSMVYVVLGFAFRSG